METSDRIQAAIQEAAYKVMKETNIARPQINLYEEWVKAGKPMLDPEAVEKYIMKVLIPQFCFINA